MGLPWIEKHRPQKLDELVGQKEITARLKKAAEDRNVPNMLFAGPAGVGKTSAAVALSKELFGKSFNQNFLELNASDDRGIDVVRTTIKEFARTLAFDSGFKIIFLDESDALTADAQQALRRTMEKYTRTTRFILSCNYSSRIIEPIQSRCVIFRFRGLSPQEVEKKIREIAEKEGITVDAKAIEAINYVSEGDLRKAVNVLQASSSLSKKVDEKSVFNVASRARPAEIREMIDLALKGNFIEAGEKLRSLMYDYGMSGEDVVTQMYREVIAMPEKELPSKRKIELVDKIGEYNFRLVEGANERIQLEALLAQFMKKDE
ncbi:MAG: replication factor C small subunit [Candidatus Diapherotrites archaeon]|uniref:Replication factor C small subunit n=1 Tax=Candidatus Iainarchaeum sp. TaxID=3101447 RepID=A0A7J4IUY1_9ARCH|nr:replication factor C small subunit [Candidatus Diapherotrites archaeon]HIH08159.1 replication factor C small subunit [Candidatus Diapherotrites archaeon]